MRTVPVEVANLHNIVSIAAGANCSLAIKNDGTAWAWGCNDHGQLGNNTTTNSATPVQVLNLSGVKMVCGNNWSSAALENNGTVWTWGDNANGELGNGTYNNSSVPIQVTSLSGIDMLVSDGLGYFALAPTVVSAATQTPPLVAITNSVTVGSGSSAAGALYVEASWVQEPDTTLLYGMEILPLSLPNVCNRATRSMLLRARRSILP
jgi:alpha-tubulin suppressor-like RCC1 family protein